MNVKLISHVNGDGDLLEAWFRYYQALGVSSFHLVVHGPREENACLFDLVDDFPIFIEEQYQEPYSSENQQSHTNRALSSLADHWVLLADSDEFVELPYPTLGETIDRLKEHDANTLFAPMIQRIRLGGLLESPETIEDPFALFPLCSHQLYEKMGAECAVSKFPLFFCSPGSGMCDGGNHGSANGPLTRLAPLRNVTHHFKWRRNVLDRIRRRVSNAPQRVESLQYIEYLAAHNNRVPTEGSFHCSRVELFRRGFLRHPDSEPQGADPWDELSRSHELRLAVLRCLQSFIPLGERIILVDQEQLRCDISPYWPCVPFRERDGCYWGPPANDAEAIREFQRLRKHEARFLVFTRHAFWWLEYYQGFARHVRDAFPCLLQAEDLAIFDLMPSPEK